MSEAAQEYVPFCVRPDWEHSAMIYGWGRSYRLLFWSDGGIGFEHTCDRGERGIIVCAPLLSSHEVTGRDKPTINPSVLCPDCGTHGFIREGRWHAA